MILPPIFRLEYPKKEDPAVYPAGAPVEVLYDPDDPTHFHLDRGDLKERSTRDAIIIALVGLTGTLAALALLVCTNV